MELPKRKRMRLEGYDYSGSGVYFLTLCSKDKKPIFSQIVGRGILDAPLTELTAYGQSVKDAITYINQKNQNLAIEHSVIMPNHVHLLVRVNEQTGGAHRSESRATGEAIPKFVSSLKRYTNKLSGTELWQTGYYDHIVRDEQDYRARWEYIDGNPARWTEDEYNKQG